MIVDLVTVLRLARDRNLDLALVREKIREARANETLAMEQFWPSAWLGGRFNRHEGITQSTEGAFLDVDKQSVFGGGAVGVRWDLGNAVYETLAARQRRRASEWAAEEGRHEVALAAGTAYLEMVRSQATAKVADESAAFFAQIAVETEQKVQAGSGFEGDTLQAAAERAHHTLRAIRAREDRQVAHSRLAEILDLPPGVDLEPADAVPAVLNIVSEVLEEQELISSALASRADLRTAVQLREGARRDLQGARIGPLIPEVQAEGSVGGLGHDPSDLDSSDDYRVTVGWRFGAGGLFDKGRTDLAESRYRSACLEVSRTRARIVREVREARAQFVAMKSALDISEQGMRDAMKAMDLYRQRLGAGVGLALETVVAAEAAARAQLDWIDAVARYDGAQLRLLFAIGGTTPH